MMLDIEHLSKRYRKGPLANDDVSLQVAAGEVYGLLGHNGAGKTTLANQVVGLVRPDAGRITLGGRDAVAHPAYARRTCAVQPQFQVPLRGVTPAQAIETVARIRGASRVAARSETADLLSALDITEWARTPGERLSGGGSRLTAFCMAVAGPSRMVILDEPTNDVDPARRRLLWGHIRSIADRGRAVLVITHNVIEAERCVDRLSILHGGRVIAAGTPQAIRGDASSLEDRYLQLTGSATASDGQGAGHAALAA